jgi:hypothetical protein
MTSQNTRTRASGDERGSSNPRARIVAATRKLLAEEGYEGVTMKRIAREALAAVLLSCFSGLALQKMADPDGFDLDAAYAILWRLAQAEGVVEAP